MTYGAIISSSNLTLCVPGSERSNAPATYLSGCRHFSVKLYSCGFSSNSSLILRKKFLALSLKSSVSK